MSAIDTIHFSRFPDTLTAGADPLVVAPELVTIHPHRRVPREFGIEAWSAEERTAVRRLPKVTAPTVVDLEPLVTGRKMPRRLPVRRILAVVVVAALAAIFGAGCGELPPPEPPAGVECGENAGEQYCRIVDPSAAGLGPTEGGICYWLSGSGGSDSSGMDLCRCNGNTQRAVDLLCEAVRREAGVL